MISKKEYEVKGMSCQHCVKAVEKELEKLPVEEYNVEIGTVEVKYDDEKVKPADIEKAISDAGYDIVK